MTALLDERTGASDRFLAPLYTITEAARYLSVPQSTFSAWANGYRVRRLGRQALSGQAILTVVDRGRTAARSYPSSVSPRVSCSPRCAAAEFRFSG